MITTPAVSAEAGQPPTPFLDPLGQSMRPSNGGTDLGSTFGASTSLQRSQLVAPPTTGEARESQTDDKLGDHRVLALGAVAATPSATEAEDCDGRGANIVGNDNDNHLQGGTNQDSIVAKGGDDWVEGGTQEDFLCGNEGSDRQFTGIDGGAGPDRLFGHQGNDEAHGGDDRDDVYGNDGGDDVFGSNEVDFVYGGDGDDGVEGGFGSDSLFGQENADILRGGAGADYFHGGNGYDYCFGGPDTERLFEGCEVIDES